MNFRILAIVMASLLVASCSSRKHTVKSTTKKQPAKKEVVVVPAKKKKKPAKIIAISSGGRALSQRLEESIKIIEKAGGIDQAKQVLAAVKDLENLN